MREHYEKRWGDLSPKEQAEVLLPIIESVNSFTKSIKPLCDSIEQNPFLRDILEVSRSTSKSDKDARSAACARLARNYFSRRMLFVPQRWAYLNDAFMRRADGDLESAWIRMAVPAIYVAIKEIPGDLLVDELYSHLRCKIRREIEKDLLDGLTVDEYIYRQALNIPLPDEDTPEAQAIDRQLAAEFPGLANLQVSTLSVLQSLTPEEIEILLGASDEIAERRKIKAATIRKRKERIIKKIAKILG